MSLVRNGSISSSDTAVSKKYFEEYERIFGKFVPSGLRGHGPKSKDASSIRATDDPNSSVGKIIKDKTLFRRIVNSKNPFADKGIKREAMAIEQENVSNRKARELNVKREALQQTKINLRKAGGYCE